MLGASSALAHCPELPPEEMCRLEKSNDVYALITGRTGTGAPHCEQIGMS
jgi:hypothetical protein